MYVVDVFDIFVGFVVDVFVVVGFVVVVDDDDVGVACVVVVLCVCVCI